MPTRVGIVLVIAAAAFYSAVFLPPHLRNLAIAQYYVFVVLGAGLACAGAAWRLRSFEVAAAAGLSFVAGALSLFWPAVEIVFQHVDGGGLSLSANAVFLAGILSSVIALSGAVVTLARPALGFRLLTAACVVSAVAALLAPDAPPSARRELTLGLPLLVAAAATQWLANRRAV